MQGRYMYCHGQTEGISELGQTETGPSHEHSVRAPPLTVLPLGHIPHGGIVAREVTEPCNTATGFGTVLYIRIVNRREAGATPRVCF